MAASYAGQTGAAGGWDACSGACRAAGGRDPGQLFYRKAGDFRPVRDRGKRRGGRGVLGVHAKAVPCDIPDGDPKGASDRGQDPDRIKDSVRKGSEKIQDCSLCLENKNKTKFLLYKMIESDIVKILAA